MYPSFENNIDQEKRNLLLDISYDGSGYHGWQIQKNARSVQEVFQKSLEKVLKERVDIKGCSRTDSFVHANTYCVNFKISNKIKAENLIYAMNRVLPDDICVKNATVVPDDFNARYSCIGKEYIYKIWNSRIKNPFLQKYALHYWYDLKIDALNEATGFFIGTHDFTSFSTVDKKREATNMVRTIKSLKVEKNENIVTVTVSADGFLYNMVRIIIGTLLRISQGKISPKDIPKIINLKNRKYAGTTAPPQGLYLNKVFYDESINFKERENT